MRASPRRGGVRMKSQTAHRANGAHRWPRPARRRAGRRAPPHGARARRRGAELRALSPRPQRRAACRHDDDVTRAHEPPHVARLTRTVRSPSPQTEHRPQQVARRRGGRPRLLEGEVLAPCLIRTARARAPGHAPLVGLHHGPIFRIFDVGPPSLHSRRSKENCRKHRKSTSGTSGARVSTWRALRQSQPHGRNQCKRLDALRE